MKCNSCNNEYDEMKHKHDDMEYRCVKCNIGTCDNCVRWCEHCKAEICLKHTVNANGIDACESCADIRVD